MSSFGTTLLEAALGDLASESDNMDALRRTAALVIQRETQARADPQSAQELAEAAKRHLDAFLLSLASDSIGLGQEIGGILKLTVLGASYLREIGPHGAGATTAERMMRDGREAWKWRNGPGPEFDPQVWQPWTRQDSTIPFVWSLMRVLFYDANDANKATEASCAGPSVLPPQQVSPKWPSVSAVVLRQVINAHLSLTAKVAVDNGHPEIRDRAGVVVGSVEDRRIGDSTALRSVLAATRSLLGHRLFRYVVRAGVVRHTGTRGADHGMVFIPGGLKGLATELGLAGSSAAIRLRTVLDGFASIAVRLPFDVRGKPRSLLSWSALPESPGQRCQLRIALADALLPNFTVGIPKTTMLGREARRLVAVPTDLPPFVGHPRSFAGQALLHLLLMQEMSVHAEVFFRHGYVHIPRSRWIQLAGECRISGELLSLVLDEWLNGVSPVLERGPSEDLYSLGPGCTAEKEFIRRGGEFSARGRARQAASASARRKILPR